MPIPSIPARPFSLLQQPMLFRPFFLAAIATILSAGAVWGAVLLWQVGMRGSYTGVSIHAINAHGHAQIFGWVGLFIMGFAYQAFPMIWKARLPAPHLAVAVFALMLAGIAASVIGQAAPDHIASLVLVRAGGLVQIAAVLIFCGQMILILRRSRDGWCPSAGFILGALVWFAVMSVMNLWHTLRLLQAEDHAALLTQISTWQAALRDVQVHGLALFMILGVSIRFFPGMFGMPRTSNRRGWWSLALLSAAVPMEVALLATSRIMDSHLIAGLLIIPWLMLASGCAIVVLPWRLWRPMRFTYRGGKFIRVAYLWLGISLAMLLLLPLYMVIRDMTFSHAYYGAVRHAITVGFVSMMIMGVSSRVVPAFLGINERTLSALWGPFILVNAGCALRVTLQVLTDWHSVGFTLVGVSGVLEVAGFAWWGVGLAILLMAPRRTDAVSSLSMSASARSRDTGAQALPDIDVAIGDLIRSRPELMPAIVQAGMDTCCGASLTIREIAARRGMEPNLLAAFLVDRVTDGAALPAGAHSCACTGGSVSNASAGEPESQTRRQP